MEDEREGLTVAFGQADDEADEEGHVQDNFIYQGVASGTFAELLAAEAEELDRHRASNKVARLEITFGFEAVSHALYSCERVDIEGLAAKDEANGQWPFRLEIHRPIVHDHVGAQVLRSHKVDLEAVKARVTQDEQVHWWVGAPQRLAQPGARGRCVRQ